MLTTYVVGYDGRMALREDEERKRLERAQLQAKARERDQLFAKEVKQGLHPTYKPFTYTEQGQKPNQPNRIMMEAEQAPDADVGSRRFVDFGANNPENREKLFTGDPNIGITRAQAMSRLGRGLDKDAPFTADLEVGKYNYTMPGRDPLSGRRYMLQPDRFRGNPDDFMAPKTLPKKDTAQVNNTTAPDDPTVRNRNVIDTPAPKTSLSKLDEFTKNYEPVMQSDAYTPEEGLGSALATRQAFKTPLAKPTPRTTKSPTGLTTTTKGSLTKGQRLGNLSKRAGRLALPISLGMEIADRFSVGETTVDLGDGVGIRVDEQRLKKYDSMVKDLGLVTSERNLIKKSGEGFVKNPTGYMRRTGDVARNAFMKYPTSELIGRKFDPSDAPQVSAFVALSTGLYDRFNATKFSSDAEKQKARKSITQQINELASSFVKQREGAVANQTAEWAKARSKRSMMGKIAEDIGIPFMESGRGKPEDEILDVAIRQ